jgi:hypothetical protein
MTTAGCVLTGQDQEMRISEETRHKVLRAAAEMNYRPTLMARRRGIRPPAAAHPRLAESGGRPCRPQAPVL